MCDVIVMSATTNVKGAAAVVVDRRVKGAAAVVVDRRHNTEDVVDLVVQPVEVGDRRVLDDTAESAIREQRRPSLPPRDGMTE